MGLDQYAFTRREGEKDTEIMYWRKHADLEGWMSELYYERGGEADMFNCVELELTLEDLFRLKSQYKNLEPTSGYFFGTSGQYEENQTKVFIDNAIQAIEAGYTVIYTSWW